MNQSNIRIYRDEDANISILDRKKIAILGYGAQGRAQARMLYESGVQVVVGVRENGASWSQVKEDGLTVASMKDAAESADIIHILLPDEVQKEVYDQYIKSGLKPGDILSFSHGFNIVSKRIDIPEGVGVIMVAPKSPGTEEYRAYRQGFGVPALISVHVDNKDKDAKDIALAMAKAMQFTRAGVIECTFANEAYSDLFGEQAVLCGGMSALIQAGFEVLTEAGYPPELAYFECVHEAKLIIDLIVEGGLEHMWKVVSNTAEFGGHTRGKRLINNSVKAEMKKVLAEIESGGFCNEMIEEYEKNKFSNLEKFRNDQALHSVEIVGKRVRSLFKKEERA
jgi:ketol-acid reductoisomerase